jgi:hypothetical protein
LQRVLTSVTLLGLLVATAAAFAITEHLKLMKSPLSGFAPVTSVFSPVCGRDCPSEATVRIKLRHAGRVTVKIVDSAGHEVAAISRPVRAHRPTLFAWDGRTAAGALAPDGVYHPWVELSHRNTLAFTNKLILDTQPPKVLAAARADDKSVFFAGGGRTVAIAYHFSEKAHALVYLDDRPKPIIVGRRTRERDKVKWAGTFRGRSLRPGTYVLSVGARDLAGNDTPATGRKHLTVVVSYIQIVPARIGVEAGRPFTVHVLTAAPRFTWRLGHRHAERHGKSLHLRAPTTSGTYRLVVTEHGHSTTAAVLVRAK